ncbi:MAG TPA: NAD+ synthase [Nitrospira sp.]
MRSFRLAMVQMNPTVGDLGGNVRQITAWLREARKAKADLVAFPELALTGYPPEDLLLKPKFVQDNRLALNEVIRACSGLVAIVGYVAQGEGKDELHNAAAIIAERRLVATYSKRHLPNYGVFDERRYFQPGQRLPLVTVQRTIVAVNICEDIWVPDGPSPVQADAGAEVIININASPFHIGKSRAREQMLSRRARENGVILSYTNMVGAQDELVFDGNSVIFDHAGEVVARGVAFQEELLITDLDIEAAAQQRMVRKRKKSLSARWAGMVDRVVIKGSSIKGKRSRREPSLPTLLDELDEVYGALVLGVKDYVRKNGFKHVVIGLSGGVDSAVTAVIAVDAVGPERVLGVFMPSPYTSRESREDVDELVSLLQIDLKTIPITPLVEAYGTSLKPMFIGMPSDATEENIQARIRGNILMALSNKFGHLVLTTGNKSEMSVGYATLYGDMAGGFAVIKDVPKTMVYELAARRNRRGAVPVIPKRILDRPPTAELRPDQKDEDSLPPYALLDPILKAYVEEDRSVDEIVRIGFQRAMVLMVIGLVDRSEYKRRQAPVGIKITHRGLGKDRRMPITNGYRTH